jgi:Alw26I/Eco31I/Esp3I family type II restriction m6 adenine DNA methyltransferase
VTANSLIGLPKVDKTQTSLFDDYQKIDELKNIRNDYFNATGIEREQLKTEFITQQKKLVDQLIKEHGYMGIAKAELTQQITDWEPFTHNPTSWFDTEWMFGIKDGFDIVISNPPYSELRDLSELDQEKYKHSLYHQFAKGGRLNLFQYFYPFAIDAVKNDGIVCLITQNSILAEDSALNNRKYILDKTQIIKFSSFPERDDTKKRVFEGVKMSVCVGLLKKIPDKRNYIFEIEVWYDKNMSNGHKLSLNTVDILRIFPQKLIFPLSTERSFSLLQKIMQENFDFRLCAKSGEIDMTKFSKKFNYEGEGTRVLTGAQVLKYRITNNPSQGKVCYLNKNQLEEVSSDKQNDILQERIIMQRITGVDSKIRLIMTLIPGSIFCANSTNYISGYNHNDLIYILGVLNSKLINFFYKQTSTNTNITTSEINNIPIPKTDVYKKNEIVKLVNKLLINNKDVQTEEQLNNLIYGIFRLNDDDIKIVEESIR